METPLSLQVEAPLSLQVASPLRRINTLSSLDKQHENSEGKEGMDPLEAFFCIFLLAFHRVNSLTSFVLRYVNEGQSSTLPRDGTRGGVGE